MKVLISGLNSYIGRRAASHLQTDDFRVCGFVTNTELYRSIYAEPITASLSSVDLLRGGVDCVSYKEENLELGIYFAQAPDMSDLFSLNMEMTRLKNFVEVLKRNLCNRVLFVARLFDKKYVQPIGALLEDLGMDYTIVLRNASIGKGSLADRYFRYMLEQKVILYDRDIADVEFRPVYVLDVLRWIRSVDWMKHFKKKIIEFGGIRQMSIRELFHLYRHLYQVETRGVPLPNFLYNMLPKSSKLLHKDDVDELAHIMKFEYPVDNSSWAKFVPFSFTPIEHVILGEPLPELDNNG